MSLQGSGDLTLANTSQSVLLKFLVPVPGKVIRVNPCPWDLLCERVKIMVSLESWVLGRGHQNIVIRLQTKTVIRWSLWGREKFPGQVDQVLWTYQDNILTSFPQRNTSTLQCITTGDQYLVLQTNFTREDKTVPAIPIPQSGQKSVWEPRTIPSPPLWYRLKMVIFSHCQHLLTAPLGQGGAGMQTLLRNGSTNGNSWLTGENGDHEDPEYLPPASHRDDPFIQDKADSYFLIWALCDDDTGILSFYSEKF